MLTCFYILGQIRIKLIQSSPSFEGNVNNYYLVSSAVFHSNIYNWNQKKVSVNVSAVTVDIWLSFPRFYRAVTEREAVMSFAETLMYGGRKKKRQG